MISDELIEKLILKKVLSDKAYMVLFADMYDKRWFEDDNIQKVIGLAIQYYKKYDKLAKVDTLKHLIEKYSHRDETIDISDVLSTINESVNLNPELDDKCIEDNIINYIKSRGSFFAISDNIKSIEIDRDTSKCIDRLEQFNSLILNEDLGLNYRRDQDKHWDTILNPESKLSFGIESIDKVTNGGMLADGRCLVVFLAQAGLGKSLTLSNIARYNAMNDKKVVIITLELSQDVYAKRIDAHISGCNIDELIGQQKRARSEIDKFNNDHANQEIIIKEYPPNSISCSAIDVYLERLKTSGIVADLILIDYLNLLVPRGKQTESSYTDIGNVSREMRALTYKWNVPICTATQANTQGYNSEDIGMENISESRGIAHTADFIMALYQTDEDREAGVIKGAVLKNRLGGYIGKRIPLKLDPFSLRLTDTTDQIDVDEVDRLLGDDNDIIEDDVEPVIDVEMDVHNM
jgi:hypothetical protein